MEMFNGFTIIGLKIVAGFIVGYLVASYIESYMHQNVSDANMKRVKKWKKHPTLFWYFIRTHYSHHVIHHVKTFKQNYVTQFRNEDEKLALDKVLDGRGRHGEIIKQSRYAVKLHGSGSLVFIAPLLPAIPLFSYTLGPWSLVGAVMALSLPPIFSNYIHQYLHMPHEHAIKQAPPLIAWLLKTEYFKAVARNHYMHHRYMVGNFNLVLGGDILRGVNRKPSDRDIQHMLELGLPVTQRQLGLLAQAA
ncbi:MAG: hypothetical protein OEZ58_16565 [Gammaproteobacteria bacterium]|nr:hypothetical protein [Gammaproteobacteria bacterium]MDH5730605.1 hypothetical protein [Gammaproteobacteria bacterium]